MRTILSALCCLTALQAVTHQEITLAPVGPFRVEGTHVLDSRGREFRMRGTELQPFRLAASAQDRASGTVFGPHSATTLSAIRLRFNLNTVRIAVNPAEASGHEFFAELAKVVRTANEMELLAIVAAPPDAAFWERAAAYFRGHPNVLFETSADAAAVGAIRKAGARQPVIAHGPTPLDDPGIVRGASVPYGRTAEFVPEAAPVLASGWDLRLSDAAACAELPSEPGDVAALVQANLDYFDKHGISWIASRFVPGELISDLSLHDATSLENGWTCGKPVYPFAGMGRVIQAHMRANKERELFVVSGSGSPDVARGGFALAYGPIMADRDSANTAPVAPRSLGRLSIQIVDSRGVSRPAGLLWASAGWGQVNFVIPEESAAGPARLILTREDGSSTATNITVAETAPGFVTGHSCRGPAIGESAQGPISSCKGEICSTIAVAPAAEIRIQASGFRNAKSKDEIEVTIGGVPVPVVAYGAADRLGADYLTISVPQALAGLGEADLVARVNGRVSNAVRIRIGGRKPVS